MAPTTLLMLCLLAATLLGGGIGACLWHLRLARRHEAVLASLDERAERERRALDAMLAAERERGVTRHEEASREIGREREKAARAVARHDALVVGAKERDRLIESLRGEVRGLEERHLTLQRDLARERAERVRAAPTSRASAAAPEGEGAGEDGVPVLNRRVGVRPGARAGGASSGARPPRSPSRAAERASDFPIGGDLDIPTLAESELPDADGDLVLDLLDTGNLFRDVDER